MANHSGTFGRSKAKGEESVKFIPSVPMRTKALVAVLLVVVAVYAVSAVQASLLRKELSVAAQAHVSQYTEDEYDYVPVFTVSKAYILFGNTQGLVEVFMRPKKDPSDPQIYSVEYYYERRDGKWVFTGSGAGTSDEVRGQKAFEGRL